MKLKYKTLPVSEGGAALPDCGTIHNTEIEPTLDKLSEELEFPFHLNDYIIGSTGKGEYSGDIDVVLDDRWWGYGPFSLKENLIELYGEKNVAQNGSMIHLKYPIVGYNAALNKRKPRTGFVQIDFKFGNYEWLKFFHQSPGDDSEYKGAHRNLMIFAICSAANIIPSREIDALCRPVSVVRYTFTETGLFKVRRSSKKDSRSGQWMRNQVDEIMEGPITDPAVVARMLLPVNGTITDLFSLETILTAIKQNYGMVDCERICRSAAGYFNEWKDGRNFYYPEEISKYFHVDDK